MGIRRGQKAESNVRLSKEGIYHASKQQGHIQDVGASKGGQGTEGLAEIQVEQSI
jgi:hypothetical protein